MELLVRKWMEVWDQNPNNVKQFLSVKSSISESKLLDYSLRQESDWQCCLMEQKHLPCQRPPRLIDEQRVKERRMKRLRAWLASPTSSFGRMRVDRLVGSP